MRRLVIGGITIDDSSPCYVIAEIGHNHQGDLEKCKELFRAAQGMRRRRGQAAEARQPLAVHPRDVRPALRQREQLRRHLRRAPRGARVRPGRVRRAAAVRARARHHASSRPPSTSRAPTSSPSSTCRPTRSPPATCSNMPLLRYVAQLGKPMIVSTGGATMEDVERAYDAIMPDQPAALRSCSARPATRPSSRSSTCGVIDDLPGALPGARRSASRATTTASRWRSPPTCSGARIIEKHFTLNRP